MYCYQRCQTAFKFVNYRFSSNLPKIENISKTTRTQTWRGRRQMTKRTTSQERFS